MRQLQLSLLLSLPQPLKPLSLYTFSLRIAKLCDSVDMSLQHRHCLHYYYYHLRYNQYLLVKEDERR